MYKLTYDSDENDEINASSTVTTNQQSTTDPTMKPDVKDKKEKANENPSPKEKRKSVGGTYEGNGRYYSLFANENFLTEETSDKKKKCCRVGIKSAFLIGSVILLIFSIIGLMWVVRGMQVEQNSLKLRIAKLEDNSAVMISTLNHPSMAEASIHQTQHRDSPCCNTNREQITYLDEVLKGHESRFRNFDEKLQAYRSTGDVKDAQISRNIAQNAADITNVRTKFNTVNNEVSNVQKVAEAAKSLALFATKGASLTEDQIFQYLKDIGGISREGEAFTLAHATRSGYVTGEFADEVPFDYDQGLPPPLPIVYDVSSESSPIITFRENLIDGAGEIVPSQPESGTVTIQKAGRYFLSAGFCVHTHEETTVQILLNGLMLREFTVAGTSLGTAPSAVEIQFNPPPGFEYVMDEHVMATPPLPPAVSSDASPPVVRPYQFHDIVNLDMNDELQMKILTGTIAEYTYYPGTYAAKSCTRFLGFRI